MSTLEGLGPLLSCLTDIERKRANMSNFTEGDRVVRVGPHRYSSDPIGLDPFGTTESRLGSIGTVRFVYTDGDVLVEWDETVKTSVIARASLAGLVFGAEPEPEPAKGPYTVGDKLTVVDNGGALCHHFALGTVVTVTEDGEGNLRAEGPLTEGHILGQWLDPSDVEPLADRERELLYPVNAVGCEVYVTGDSDKWGHGLETGTLLTLTGDDLLEDGSYACDDAEVGTFWVGANDLDVYPPARDFEVGDRVTVSGNEGEYHLHPVGSVGEVISRFGRGEYLVSVFRLGGARNEPGEYAQVVKADDLTLWSLNGCC